MIAYQDLPGPGVLSFLGELEYGLSPRRFALRNLKRYGRVYRARGLAGDVVFTSEPQHVRRIFSADADTFETFGGVAARNVLGEHSVALAAGESHSRQRKLLAPALNGSRLRRLGARMEELAHRRLGALIPGQHFRAMDLATDFTLDVIVQTVLGGSKTCSQAELRSLAKSLVYDVPPYSLLAPKLQTSWFRPWRRYLLTRQRFDTWLTQEVAARKHANDEAEDVLSMLLSARYEDGSVVTNDELRDQLVSLLLAGQELSAIALANCLAGLHRHPEVLARLRDELSGATVGDIHRLPYLAAVVDETLRIDPVLTDVSRIPTRDFALDAKLVVRPKQLVMVLIEALHHDPQLYPDPSQFRPERFLQRKFAPSEFAPFGGGVRHCLGAAFTYYEVKIFLAALVRNVSLAMDERSSDSRVRRNGATLAMGPRRGATLRVLSCTGP